MEILYQVPIIHMSFGSGVALLFWYVPNFNYNNLPSHMGFGYGEALVCWYVRNFNYNNLPQ